MNYSKLRDSAELIGIAAIVASLIFVGLQMKQSQQIAIATQYHARAEAVMNFELVQFEADWVGGSMLARLSNEISARDIHAAMWMWIAMDNHYYQYQAGFLDDDSWRGQLQNIAGLYARCNMRFIWDRRKTAFRPQFASLVESMDDPCEGELQE